MAQATTAAKQDGSLGRLVESLSSPRRFGALVAWAVRVPVLGRWIAELMRAPVRVRFISTRVTRLHARLLRRSGGRLRRSWMFAAGQPVLALTTTGRRSGVARSTAVACFTSGEDLALAGMNLGGERDPSWALNLEASSTASIELGGELIAVSARRVRGEEASRLWARWLELQPSAAAFRDLAGREIPIFVLTRRA